MFAIVSFNGATRVTNRFLAKARSEQSGKVEQYLSEHQALNVVFENEWLRLEPYAHRLWEHLYRKSGKHAQLVSDQEIDTLIEDCLRFSIVVKKAVRREDRLLRKLSPKEKALIPFEEHQAWHQMYYGARYIMREFENLRKNDARPTVERLKAK